MAFRRPPAEAGDIVELRGPRGSTLVVDAPDGLQVRIPAPHGCASVWLPQTGEWAYAWDDGPSGTLTVIDPPAEPVTEPAVDAGPVTVKPRQYRGR